jgi:hypothetical protein
MPELEPLLEKVLDGHSKGATVRLPEGPLKLGGPNTVRVLAGLHKIHGEKLYEALRKLSYEGREGAGRAYDAANALAHAGKAEGRHVAGAVEFLAKLRGDHPAEFVRTEAKVALEQIRDDLHPRVLAKPELARSKLWTRLVALAGPPPAPE